MFMCADNDATITGFTLKEKKWNDKEMHFRNLPKIYSGFAWILATLIEIFQQIFFTTADMFILIFFFIYIYRNCSYFRQHNDGKYMIDK